MRIWYILRAFERSAPLNKENNKYIMEINYAHRPGINLHYLMLYNEPVKCRLKEEAAIQEETCMTAMFRAFA